MLIFCHTGSVFGRDSDSTDFPEEDLTEVKLTVSAGEKEPAGFPVLLKRSIHKNADSGSGLNRPPAF